MGLAWGQGGGGLQARSGEGKLNKRQSMANAARPRALLGQNGGWEREGSPGACHLWLPSVVLRATQYSWRRRG